MTDGQVRLLDDEEWAVLREVRLEGLRDSPESFFASYDEEAKRDEHYWRKRMQTSRWLVSEREGQARAVVGLRLHNEDPESGEVFGLWVSPELRRSRLGRELVREAVDQAVAEGRRRLYFWVGSSNGPAVAFASVLGFRPTSERRQARSNADDAAHEVAMVLTLAHDTRSVENPQLP